MGKVFNIAIGTRQGCNLSPSLFNIFTSDLPYILGKIECDPVTLDSIKINTLMYADDMLLLSRSQKGLEKAICVLEIYCKKWQLKINPDKTKIMIFNKRETKNCSFQIDGKDLAIVKSYNYLGLLITNSGIFLSQL